MKNLINFLEAIIIVCIGVIIITPEIAYSMVLRVRDKVEELAGEL